MTVPSLALELVELTNALSLLSLNAIAAGFLTLPCLYMRQKRARPGGSILEPGDEALSVLVQLPVYNEPHMVAPLLDCMSALDWPRDRLHIQLLDDSTDETSEIARVKIRELESRGVTVDHVRREHRAGFKAAALAAGLERSNAPVIAILDADFRPPPHWLRAVVPRLMGASDAAFVQSRCELANRDDNWLTRAQSLLFDSHYVMEQGVRADAGFLIQFNGTAAVWRREAIESAGGWSSQSLSEDLDLAARAALAGWRGFFAAEPAVPGLAPRTLADWRVQQKRWTMGFAQNARTLPGQIWRADWSLSRKLSAEFMLLYQFVLPAVPIAILATGIDIACGCPDWAIELPLWSLTLFSAAALAIGMTLPPYITLRRGGAGGYVSALATLPVLVIFLAFVNAKAMVLGLSGGDDVFRRTPKPHESTPDEAPAARGAPPRL